MKAICYIYITRQKEASLREDCCIQTAQQKNNKHSMNLSHLSSSRRSSVSNEPFCSCTVLFGWQTFAEDVAAGVSFADDVDVIRVKSAYKLADNMSWSTFTRFVFSSFSINGAVAALLSM